MPAKPRKEQPADEAKFVFQGTVSKVRAVTMPDVVPVSDRTVVVRVDRVVNAPQALSDYAGHEITVQLATDEKVQVGQSFVFYTNGWIFGDSLAVQSVRHEAATVPVMAALSRHPDDPVQSLKAREAAAQAARADLIVTGRVSTVRIPPEEVQARAAAVAGRTAERISEHAPLWQEAVIEVDAVHKGTHDKQNVVVRFPSSSDVRWHKAPKFHPGQEGVFLLHKDQLARAQPAGRAALAHGGGPDVYTALDGADVQPLEELPQLLAGQGGGG